MIAKPAILIDTTLCTGCEQCVLACKFENELGRDRPWRGQEAIDALSATRFCTIHRREGQRFVRQQCRHCLEPACVSACLVGALRKQPNGAVTYDAWKCMGCRYCMVACPFDIPRYEYDNVFTPQVRKCTFCSNEGNPYKGDTPACVRACPKQCLIYGKRSELLSRARSRIKQHPHQYIEHIYGEHEAGGTSWLYLSGTPFEEIGFLKTAPEAPSHLSEAIQHGVFNHFVPPVTWAAALAIAMWMSRPGEDQQQQPVASVVD